MTLKQKARTTAEWKELGLKCWSFSRLNAFEVCPKMYELTYVKRLDGVSNFFSEFGSFVHKIYEQYARGELKRKDLEKYYMDHWKENVVTDAPSSPWVDFFFNWFEKGLAAMQHPPMLKEYEVLGIEKEVHFNVDGEKAVGFIDLLLRRKKDGAILLVDHKSGKAIKVLKSGKISKTDQERFAVYRRQLYLYAKPIIEKYGKVDELVLNFFNDGTMYSIPWNQADYDEAKSWASATCQAIAKCKRWKRAGSEFFCNNICGQREHCRI